jgi:hypothetical protein
MLDPPVVSRAAGRLAYDTLPLVDRLLGIDQGLGAFRKLSYDEGVPFLGFSRLVQRMMC